MSELISTEGPGLPLVARLYVQGRYRRATVDTSHHGTPLTYLSDAREWQQKAMLRQQMIEDLIKERDELRAAASLSKEKKA